MAKGGKTSTTQAIPEYLQEANKEAINDARSVSQLGYVPYFGPDVAAFSPMQQQSMRSTGNAASSFGLAPQGFDGTAGIPQAQTFAGGIQGYSSAPIYEQALDNLYAKAPAQYRAIKNRFIDPFTGARPNGGGFANAQQTSQMFSNGDGNGNNGFFDQAHADRMAQMSSTGRHYGVNSQYNPYAGDASVDINGDGVINMYDMTFGEDGRRPIGDVEKYGNMIFGRIPRIIDGVQGSLFDLMGEGKVSEDPAYLAQQQQLMNDAAARGEAKYAREEADRIARQNQLGLDYIQRGDMYPSQIESGLLNGTPFASSNIVDLSAARQAEDLAAQQRAAKIKAEAQAAAILKQASEAAAAQAAAQRSTVNSNNGGPKGNNSWQGTNSSGTAKKGFSFGL